MKKLKFINGRCSIAEGEGVGKHHCVLETPGTEVFKNTDGSLLIKVGEQTELDHPEHGTIILPADTDFEVRIQREYDPEKQWRQVQD